MVIASIRLGGVNEDDETRPAIQIFIPLSAAIAEALSAASIRDDRPLKRQAVRYIIAGLRRDGFLPPDPDSEQGPER